MHLFLIACSNSTALRWWFFQNKLDTHRSISTWMLVGRRTTTKCTANISRIEKCNQLTKGLVRALPNSFVGVRTIRLIKSRVKLKADDSNGQDTSCVSCRGLFFLKHLFYHCKINQIMKTNAFLIFLNII